MDNENHRLMSYAAGATNGTLLLGGTGAGNSNTKLNYPVGIHFHSLSNSLIIANQYANNIVRYTLGASFWTLVAGDINGSSGVTSDRLNRPHAVTLDPMGNLYVADRLNQRIQFFYVNNLNGTTIAGTTAVTGNNATTFNRPWSLRLDTQLNLYVADAYNHRIQKFIRY